jgi:hypothetical protein
LFAGIIPQNSRIFHRKKQAAAQEKTRRYDACMIFDSSICLYEYMHAPAGSLDFARDENHCRKQESSFVRQTKELSLMEKVWRFDRKTIKGVHRLFRGVHFNLGGCKWQRGCILNDWVR